MKGGKKILIVGLVIIVLLLAVVVLLVMKLNAKPAEAPPEPTREMRSVLVNEENVGEVAEQIRQQNERPIPRSYTATMSSEWHFPDGKSASPDAYVENVKANKYAVWFDVTVDATGDKIFESPVMPVNTHLRNIVLDKDLDAGTYDCTLVYHLVDDDQYELTTLSLALTVIVES